MSTPKKPTTEDFIRAVFILENIDDETARQFAVKLIDDGQMQATQTLARVLAAITQRLSGHHEEKARSEYRVSIELEKHLPVMDEAGQLVIRRCARQQRGSAFNHFMTAKRYDAIHDGIYEGLENDGWVCGRFGDDNEELDETMLVDLLKQEGTDLATLDWSI